MYIQDDEGQLVNLEMLSDIKIEENISSENDHDTHVVLGTRPELNRDIEYNLYVGKEESCKLYVLRIAAALSASLQYLAPDKP